MVRISMNLPDAMQLFSIYFEFVIEIWSLPQLSKLLSKLITSTHTQSIDSDVKKNVLREKDVQIHVPYLVIFMCACYRQPVKIIHLREFCVINYQLLWRWNILNGFTVFGDFLHCL